MCHAAQVISLEQFLRAQEILDSYHRTEDGIASNSAIPVHFNVPFAFYSMRKLLNDRLSRCAVTNLLGVLSGGELSLCGIGVAIPEFVYGDAETDDLREVWCHSPGLIRLREQIPAQLEGICSRCLHRDLCRGCCVALNYHEAGRLNAPYHFCDRAEALGLFPASRKR